MDFSRKQALDHEVEGPPHLADRVHTVEDAPGPEAVLSRPVAVAHLAERVVFGNPHVVVADFAVVRRRGAPDPDSAHDGHPGVRGGHDDLDHATGPLTVGVAGPAHDDEEIGGQPVGSEPLVSVDDPFVALEDRVVLMEPDQIRPCPARSSRTPTAWSPRRGEKPLLLLLGAVLGQDGLVSRIRCDDPEQRCRAQGVGEDLVHIRMGQKSRCPCRRIRGADGVPTDPLP